MNEQEIQQIKITLGIIARLQSTINGIDELQNCSRFIHDLKKRTNQYQEYLERNLHMFYKLSGLKESEKMMILVTDIDEICNGLEVDV